MDIIRQTILAAVVNTSPLPHPTADSARIQLIVNVVFVTLGAASALVVTIAGFRYTISHGDPKLIEQSKNSILYAVIGLVVSIAAVTIVNFTIGRL